MKARRAALTNALTGRFDAHHAELARMLLERIGALTARIGGLDDRIGEQIPGIARHTAQVVFAESGSPGALPLINIPRVP